MKKLSKTMKSVIEKMGKNGRIDHIWSNVTGSNHSSFIYDSEENFKGLVSLSTIYALQDRGIIVNEGTRGDFMRCVTTYKLVKGKEERT